MKTSLKVFATTFFISCLALGVQAKTNNPSLLADTGKMSKMEKKKTDKMKKEDKMEKKKTDKMDKMKKDPSSKM